MACAHLSRILLEYSHQRTRFATELKILAHQWEGSLGKSGLEPPRAVHYPWEKIATAVKEKDLRATLSACERGESAVANLYLIALKKGFPRPMVAVVRFQYDQILEGQRRIHTLKVTGQPSQD